MTHTLVSSVDLGDGKVVWRLSVVTSQRSVRAQAPAVSRDERDVQSWSMLLSSRQLKVEQMSRDNLLQTLK